MPKIPARIIIERILKAHPDSAIHEIAEYAKQAGFYVSENAIGTRLPEMAKDGIIESEIRPGTKYKQWNLREQLGNNGEPMQETECPDPDELNEHSPKVQGFLL